MRSLAWALLVVVAGCTGREAPIDAATPVDGGAIDGAAIDSGRPGTDAGAGDAGDDAGARDGGAGDAGQRDAGQADAGSGDAGRVDAAGAIACTDEAPCAGACVGSICGGDWTCDPSVACTDDLVAYCGCDGLTFHGSSACPPRPYSFRGECGATFDCRREVMCRRAEPICPAGQVVSVIEGADGFRCWGACVPITQCTCSAPADCPAPYACDTTAGACG